MLHTLVTKDSKGSTAEGAVTKQCSPQVTLGVCEARRLNPRTTTSSAWSSNSKINRMARRMAKVGTLPVEELKVTSTTVIQCLMLLKAALSVCTKPSQRLLPQGPSLWQAVRRKLEDLHSLIRTANCCNYSSRRRGRGLLKAIESRLRPRITKTSTKDSPNSWRPSKTWGTITTPRNDRASLALSSVISLNCTIGPSRSYQVSTWTRGQIWAISCTCLMKQYSHLQDLDRIPPPSLDYNPETSIKFYQL